MINLIFKFLRSKLFLVILPSLIFLIIGIWTLPHYGMNWDEPIHFMRGQAYLHYFLTGEKDYKSIPPYPRLIQECLSDKKDCSVSPPGTLDKIEYQGNITYEEAILKNIPQGQKIWRSYYQHDDYTFHEFIKMEEGHPPLGGILAALTNKIFYQYLHIITDIEGYHLFEVLASFAIVLIVPYFTYYTFGTFPAVVAGIVLASYPLFFGESHFNIKDPPMAAFFGLTLISFYFGIIKNNWKLTTASAILFGVSMGIKFNIAFLPIIIIPWLLVYLITYKSGFKKLLSIHMLISIVLYPIVATLIFYILWPFLWPDPINNFLKILTFYRQIGIGTPHELAEYIVREWNTYPMLWVIYTTPIPVLILTIVGVVGSFFDFLFKRKHLPILILLWFVIPILRVSYPGTSIYGGIRQIMEYIPAMSVLAGAGGYYLIKYLPVRYSRAMILIIITALTFSVYEVVKIHPNENVYFNQLIGGLSGARDKKIPYWGNSYGNVYQQGIAWLNENAEPGAKLGFPVSTGQNLARVKLRPDIFYWNAHWSGPNMGGEYEMELDFDWAPKEWYSYAYYDIFVEPVYVASVDGVPLLKIWKNDLAHTRPGYEKEIEYQLTDISIKDGQMKIDLGKLIPLTRVVVEHSKIGCEEQKGGYIATSEDGENWKQDPETIASPQVPVNVTGWDGDTFVFLFAGRLGRFILLDTKMANSCYLKNPQIKVFGLPTIPTLEQTPLLKVNHVASVFEKIGEKITLLFKLGHKRKTDYYKFLVEKRLAEMTYVIENNQIDLVEPTASRYATYLGNLTNYVSSNKILEKNEELTVMYDEHAKIILKLQKRFEFESGWWLALQHDINSISIYEEKLLIK